MARPTRNFRLLMTGRCANDRWWPICGHRGEKGAIGASPKKYWKEQQAVIVKKIPQADKAAPPTGSLGSTVTCLAAARAAHCRHGRNTHIDPLYSVEQQKYNRSNVAARDVPADALEYYNLGQAGGQITVDPANQDYQLWGLMSAMGRVMYSYDNRYMISATVRSDASSRLAPGHKWHTYPAVSVGWNITNESFMRNAPIINNLKLRVGYGQTSNQAIAPYATLGRLDTRPYNFGPSSYSTGFFVSQLPNPDLGWEFSKTLNFGLDFSLLKNRLSGTIEYYVTKTEDILLGLGLPPTSGVSGYTANIGSTENKGFELSLNGTILDDAQWLDLGPRR